MIVKYKFWLGENNVGIKMEFIEIWRNFDFFLGFENIIIFEFFCKFLKCFGIKMIEELINI